MAATVQTSSVTTTQASNEVGGGPVPAAEGTLLPLEPQAVDRRETTRASANPAAVCRFRAFPARRASVDVASSRGSMMILQAGSRSKGLRLGLRDLGGEFLVGARDVLPKVKAGNVRARPPSRVPYSPSSRRSRRTASRCRTRRAPQQAAIMRADREGSCAVVAGGGTFLDVTANFADGPVIEVHVERSSVATVAYRLQVSILTSNDDGAMSRTEAATRVIEQRHLHGRHGFSDARPASHSQAS